MRTFLAILVFLIWLLLGWCLMQDYDRCCSDSATGSEKIGLIDDGASTDASIQNEAAKSAEDGSASGQGSDSKAENSATSSVAVDPSRWKGPLTFNWASNKPILGDKWRTFKDSLLSALPNDQLLQITGLYRTGEGSFPGFDNLGLARADEIRKLFSALPDERLKFFSRESSEVTGDRSNPFNGVSYRFLINTEKIKEIEDKTVIYFAYNSTNKLNDNEVEAYLDDVVVRVRKSGEKVRITGHADSTGAPEANLQMGQWRADVIADYLLTKGVSSNQIITISRGEAQPVATNATSEGRAKNRRAELQIIK